MEEIAQSQRMQGRQRRQRQSHKGIGKAAAVAAQLILMSYFQKYSTDEGYDSKLCNYVEGFNLIVIVYVDFGINTCSFVAQFFKYDLMSLDKNGMHVSFIQSYTYYKHFCIYSTSSVCWMSSCSSCHKVYLYS